MPKKPLRGTTLGGPVGEAPPLPPPDYSLSIESDLGLGGFIFQDGKHLLHTEGGTEERNTALGLGALSNLVADYGGFSGYDNTAVGYAALENLEFGTGNTAVGQGALRYAVGAGNTAVGARALGNATFGSNTAVGNLALSGLVTGTNNVAVGGRALEANTTGSSNVAIGNVALLGNREGQANIAVGTGALFNLDGADADANVAIGDLAMFESESSRYNVAVGKRALEAATDAYANVAVGYRALYSNLTGGSNVALGRFALRDTTTGGGNVAIGPGAGSANVGGSDNVFIDHAGAVSDGTTTSNNVIRLGSNQELTFIAGIRGTTTGVADAIAVMIDSAGQLGTVSSSRSVKQDLRAIGGLSRRLLALQPVAFRYRKHAESDRETPLEFGLVAEDVARVFPELVVYDASGRPETVKYHLLSSLLLNELQRNRRTVHLHGWLLTLGLAAVGIGGVRRWRESRAPGGANAGRPTRPLRGSRLPYNR